jgi:hypothetical protein
VNKKEKEAESEDWLCRELIQNEVYGVQDDDFF